MEVNKRAKFENKKKLSPQVEDKRVIAGSVFRKLPRSIADLRLDILGTSEE